MLTHVGLGLYFKKLGETIPICLKVQILNQTLTALFASLKLCGSFSYFSGEPRGRRKNRRAQDAEEEETGTAPPGERPEPENQGLCTQLY